MTLIERAFRPDGRAGSFVRLPPATRDLIARASIGALFTLLSINLLGDFIRTGRVTGLLLLVGESLVVVLTIVRRTSSTD